MHHFHSANKQNYKIRIVVMNKKNTEIDEHHKINDKFESYIYKN